MGNNNRKECQICHKLMEPVCPKCAAKIKKDTSKWQKFLDAHTTDTHC